MAQKKKSTTKRATTQSSQAAKITKKSSSKTSSTKTTSPSAKSAKTSVTSEKNTPIQTNKKPLLTRKQLIIAAIIVLFIILLYALKGLYIAAMVNGQPITRFAVIHQLEQQNGKKTLDSLITQKLIQNEADKRGISVSQKDTDEQISKIESSLKTQGTTLDAALEQQGMTREDLNQQIKLQLIVQKMVKPVQVTDKDIASYISENQSQLPQDGNQDQLKSQVKQQIQQEKQQQEIQDFVANLRKNAHISYFTNY